MKKLLFVVFILLALVTGYLLFFRGQGGYDLPDREFGVKDSRDIQKIFIAHRDGDQFTLEKQGDHWIVDGQYRVYPNAINNVLDVITRMEIEYIPPRSAIPAIVKDLSALGTKVEIYNGAGERIRNFYVGGTDPSARSTYMIVEGQEQPYAMYIPSWEGNLRERFLLKLKDWRDRLVFSEEPDNISSVEVTYPRTPSYGFKLTREGHRQYVVARGEHMDQAEVRDVQPGAVEHFLIGFEKIGAESIDSYNPKRAQITSLVPLCSIVLNRVEGATDTLAIWPYNLEDGIVDFSPEFLTKGPFHFFGEIRGGDLYLLQLPQLEKIMVTYDYFFQVPRH